MEIDKIYHDDCINFMSIMKDGSVDMTLTDIPYDECDKESGGLRIIDKGDANTLTFDLSLFLDEIIRITKKSIYIFCGIEQVSSIFKRFKDNNLIVRHCVWEKRNPSPMNGQLTWLSATENCIFAKFPSATFNEFCKSNVWRFNSGKAKIHNTENKKRR